MSEIMNGASAEATVQGTVSTHATTTDGVAVVGKNGIAKPAMNKPSTSEKLAKIGWSNAPLDTFLRHIGKATSKSDTYQFYSVTARGVQCVAAGGEIGAEDKNVAVSLTSGVHCLSKSGVLVVPTLNVGADAVTAATAAKKPLRLRINSVDYGKNIIYVTPLNTKLKVTIPAGTILYRAGVACDQHIAMTEDPQATPTKDYNFCQRFLYTVSENMYQRMQEKEVEYGLNDYKDQALYDLRLDTEKAAFFGGGAEDGENFVDADSNRRVLHMRGLLDFDIQDIERDGEDVDTFLNTVMEKMFAVNNGSAERLMFYGAEFATALANCKWWQKQLEANKTDVEWGVTWKIIESNFGTVRAVYDPALSLTGPYSNCAFIVDPAHIRFVEQLPLTERKLDLQKAGISNTNDIVLEESVTLEVTNPKSHGFITM
jgi:hypothetical protein